MLEVAVVRGCWGFPLNSIGCIGWLRGGGEEAGVREMDRNWALVWL